MKMMNSHNAEGLGALLKLLLVLAIIALLGVTFSAAVLACHKGKPHGKDAPACEPGDPGGGGDTGTEEVVNPANLVRASFVDFGRGISADGLDTCTIVRNGESVTYDYWAWQERLLSDATSMLDDGYDKNDVLGCQSYENRSDISGGGRWFLMTTAGEVSQEQVERWLVVDFSDTADLNGVPSECPDIDSPNGGIYGGIHGFPSGTSGIAGCVDRLSVWLKADRIMKNSATQQPLEISIRYRPDGSQYWSPFGSIVHVHPLYLRDPHDDGPFGGRDCRVMSTRPAHDRSHDRELAEFSIDTGPGQSDILGRYNLPLEVCVIKVSQ